VSKNIQYVVITPVRDEEKHVRATIQSMASQTIPPTEWIIVDDGSADKTAEIVERDTANFAWIRMLRRPNRGMRKSGGGVIEAFYDGYMALDHKDWQFIVKLDGDVSFPRDYFENCFEHFARDSKLGVGGGDIYHAFNGHQKIEANPKFHVRGATKIYRRACWDAIGGLVQAPGWDTIDEVKANMLGWNSYSFNELHVLHHRVTGGADGLLRDRVKHGLACYISGYHPLFLAASCVSRLIKKPYVAGSAAICYGYLKGYWTRTPRVNDRRLIKYLRRQQLRRLWGLNTIWR
jgi:glycosyltransferase involved in cell wall biosynthesis